MASGKLGRGNIRRALKGFADLLAFDSDGMSEITRDGIENGRIQKFEYGAGASAKRLRSGSTSASSPIWPRIQPVSMLPAGSLPGAPLAESPDYFARLAAEAGASGGAVAQPAIATTSVPSTPRATRSRRSHEAGPNPRDSDPSWRTA